MEQICQNCRWWIAYDAPAETAGNGECLRPLSDGSRVRFRQIGQFEHPAALVTDFDFGCIHWQAVPVVPARRDQCLSR